MPKIDTTFMLAKALRVSPDKLFLVLLKGENIFTQRQNKSKKELLPMSDPKNIQMPYEDFKSLLDMLEYIDVSNYTEDFQMQFNDVLSTLQAKRNSIASRQAYSNLIQANKTGDEGQKFEARVEYLKKKHQF